MKNKKDKKIDVAKSLSRNPMDFTLTIVLIILKVYGVIDWNWAWVLLPVWLPLIITIMIIIVYSIILKKIK